MSSPVVTLKAVHFSRASYHRIRVCVCVCVCVRLCSCTYASSVNRVACLDKMGSQVYCSIAHILYSKYLDTYARTFVLMCVTASGGLLIILGMCNMLLIRCATAVPHWEHWLPGRRRPIQAASPAFSEAMKCFSPLQMAGFRQPSVRRVK